MQLIGVLFLCRRALTACPMVVFRNNQEHVKEQLYVFLELVSVGSMPTVGLRQLKINNATV